MSTRESIFVCRFTCSSGSCTARVRAWDEREAMEVFRGELAEEHLREDGTIEIMGPSGRRPVRAPFHPNVAT